MKEEQILNCKKAYYYTDIEPTLDRLNQVKEIVADFEAQGADRLMSALLMKHMDEKDIERFVEYIGQAREKMEKERLRLHDEVRAKATELMRAWKEGRATHKQALKEMSRLRASLATESQATQSQSILPSPDHFVVGQQVLHTIFNKRGVVTDVDERRSRVRLDMNGVNLWADMKALRIPGRQAAPSPTGKSSILDSTPRQPVAPESGGSARPAGAADGASLRLDMRGLRADVALAELERFMDKALLAGFREVEVVHGRGTGALRKQVHEFLRAFPAVIAAWRAP